MAALFCPRTTTACFRSLPRVTPPMTARAAFSLTTRTPRGEQQPTTPISQLVKGIREMNIASRKPFCSAVQVRHASTTTPPSAPPSTPDDTHLTWDRFFKLRRNRRFLNFGCSLITAASSVLIFAPILAAQDFDAWGAQISGLDPIIVMGISTFGIAAAGWLLGPTIGNLGFRIWAGRKGWRDEIAQKEKSFYRRIRKYRADASASSPQNPIPDYYGEKVASVRDYRRWLKDQRAFNLKKNKNMI